MSTQADGGQQNEAVGAGQSEVDALRAELEAMKDKYLRALAEFQNAQKRAAAERRDAGRRGQAELAKALLPVLDDFDRTLDAAQSTTDVKSITQGVRIVYDHMLKVLGEYGLERMKVSKSDPFDPVRHQAISQHATDEVEPDHIFHVAQAGYTMHDLLLRPAAVVVAKPLKSAGQPDTGRPRTADAADAQE